MITVKDVYKIIGGKVLFESLTFEINEGQKIGLVGRNGSGKSTLFRLITKEEELDGGDLFIKKDLAIGYLRQIPDQFNGTAKKYLEAAFTELNQLLMDMQRLEKEMLDPEKMEKALSRYGEVQDQFTEMGGYEVEAMISQVANGLRVEQLLDLPFRSLSGGEKTKLSLARILLEKPEVLLLDEPTNHLDLVAIEWLEQYLLQYKGAVCIISHDRSFLDHTVSTIVDLESGVAQSYKGNYSSFEQQKEEQLLAEFHQYQEQQKKIKKMKEAIRRLRQWANEANPPNPKLFKKAKSMERALEKMEKINRPILDRKKMGLTLQADGRSGNDALTAEGVTKGYRGRLILDEIYLNLRYKERLAIVGANGSGKSTLLKLLLQQEKPDAGVVKQGSSIQIGYLPQNPLDGVDDQQRMIDYFREYIRVTEGQARHLLAAFMFYGYDVFLKIAHLSGGERMRLKLAVFMHEGVNLLVLDEPTNHLDVESQEVLEEALEHFEGTVIGVSHDRYFLNRCFKETAYLVEGRLYRYLGSYNETKEKWQGLLEKPVKMEPPAKAKPSNPAIKEVPVEERIMKLEQDLNETDEALKRETGTAELKVLQKRKDVLTERIDQLYDVWMN
ncbi:ribosomal protection-like ABC-F family protein [Halobacillus naozhouensis]|uniref:ABC-F family ATP-binding cassette domain-containing protein n=1 Tax=Halobacillus naozhouensis TaxID=554880 RepID=A0ABY8IYV1_9BACI|nr:ABC-F family ATP-binding cassette domain-containing protein [Halobacillus naozhouensis]WFT75250.1 ABC-F family ATP-binding cassette domain-containing protein [Halobacillus naozhouensis]